MTLAAGVRLGPYEVVAPLGSGGMGEVHRARNPRLGREVALKVIAAAATDASRVARFAPEAQATAALKHPHILAMYDVGTAAVGRRWTAGTSAYRPSTLRASVFTGRRLLTPAPARQPRGGPDARPAILAAWTATRSSASCVPSKPRAWNMY